MRGHKGFGPFSRNSPNHQQRVSSKCSLRVLHVCSGVFEGVCECTCMCGWLWRVCISVGVIPQELSPYIHFKFYFISLSNMWIRGWEAWTLRSEDNLCESIASFDNGNPGEMLITLGWKVPICTEPSFWSIHIVLEHKEPVTHCS